MAKSIEKKILPAKKRSSKANIDLHALDLHKNDPLALGGRISEVAYQLFLKRGAGHENDLRDWLEAEQIVLAQMKSEGEK